MPYSALIQSIFLSHNPILQYYRALDFFTGPHNRISGPLFVYTGPIILLPSSSINYMSPSFTHFTKIIGTKYSKRLNLDTHETRWRVKNHNVISS